MYGQFITALVLQEIAKKNWYSKQRWMVAQPLIFVTKDGTQLKIPKGFVTDFASIPRMFWSVLPPWGRYGKAAVLHDFLYATNFFKKEKCDLLFLEAMLSQQVIGWVAKTMYYMVVRFGGKAYRAGKVILK